MTKSKMIRLASGIASCAVSVVFSNVAIAQAPQGPTLQLQSSAQVLSNIPSETFQISTLEDKGLETSVTTSSELSAFLSDSIGTLTGEPGTGPELVVDSVSESENGRTYLRLHQSYNGLRIYGSEVKAVLNDDRLMHLTMRTVKKPQLSASASISESEAISKAVIFHYEENKVESFWHVAPSSERIMVPVGDDVIEAGFLVQTWSSEGNQLHYTLVNSRGEVIGSELRTSNDSYRVYPVSPINSNQVVRSGPGVGNSQSPAGWISGDQTTRLIRGNNVSAYLDRDNNGQPDTGDSEDVTNGDFLAMYSDFDEPTTSENQDFAVQNLFYLNNIIHDDLYDHGFNEGARNFQEDNFEKGGLGSDSVNAEAQDGGSTNNANFATPGDGANPRMQMYIWTFTNPSRDSGLDSDIVWHEYGHGLTWRMIGNMSGAISGAIGEGMSDVLAILHNNDDVVGEYSIDRAVGIRSAPYTNYPRTIGDFTGTSVHFDGEIYAATMWRAGELYRASGLNNENLLDTAIDGMNFTPSAPTYLDMRDGILAAAPNSREGCMIWQAFADYGMGEGAEFEVDFIGRLNITESYTIPDSCSVTEPEVPAIVWLRGDTRPASNPDKWKPRVRVKLEKPDREGRLVEGIWSNGKVKSCTTNKRGVCAFTVTVNKQSRPSMTFTVQTIDGSPATEGPLTITVDLPEE